MPSATTFERHQPHSSFDSNGVLRSEAWNANDQLRGEDALKNAQEKQQTQPVIQATTTISNTPIQTGFVKPSESNIFKMPNASPPISPKQQQRKLQQQEPTKSIFGSIVSHKEEKRSSSPGGFKFGGNIFGGSASSSTAPSASTFKPVQETTSSIFKLPAPTVPPLQGNTNVFGNSLFKANVDNPTPFSTVSGSIFGGFKSTEPKPAATTSIFGNAAKETAGIFQQQKPFAADPFKSDNVFQHFQTKHDAPIFGEFSTTSSASTAQSKSTFQPTKTQEMEQRKLQLEKEQQLKQKQLEEEKRKLKELEEKRLREKQKQEEQRKLEEEHKHREQLKEACLIKANRETEDILYSIIQQELEKIAHDEVKKYHAVQQASKLQCDQLLSEVIQSLVEDIAHDEYAVMCYDQMLLNRYFNRWLQHLRKKREQRKLMESTPIWVTTDTRAQFAQALEHPCRDSNLDMIKRYRIGQPCDFKQLMRMGHFPLENKPPLCLFTLVGRHLLSKQNVTPAGLLQHRQYFKFLISIPSDKEELPGFETFCNKWLFKNIRMAQLETGPFVHGLQNNMALCVRKLSGIIPRNEQGDEMKNEGDHSDGVICFVSGEEFSSQARRRLLGLLNSSKNYKKIPVAIIAYNCLLHHEQISEMLGLDTLEDEGLLSKYKIFGHGVSRKDFRFRKAMLGAIDFITTESYNENSNDVQSLAMQNVLSFLESTLGEDIFYKWQESAKKNPVFRKICQEPEHVRGIFHKALQQLICITQEDFSEMPEFPEELKEFVPHPNSMNIALGLEFFPTNWKNGKGKTILCDFLKKLHLPSQNEHPPSNIEDLELWILNFASHCLPFDDIVATKAAHEAIRNVFQQLKDTQILGITMNERFECLNYLSILKPIVFAHINYVLRDFSQHLEKTPVIYLKNDLHAYQTQPWWLNYQPLHMVNMDYTQQGDDEPVKVAEEQTEKLLSSQIEDIVAKAEATSRRVEENLLAIKQNKSQKASILSSGSLQLKRCLDESLYKFELSKKIGHYDTSYITDLTQGIDTSIQEVFNKHSSLSPESPRKRKRLPVNSSPEKKITKTTNVDDVISRAMLLIQKVESMDDRREKRNKSNKFGI